VKLDIDHTSSILLLNNGNTIKAKVLIGCDGVNSVVGNFLALKPTQVFSSWAVRGFTHYPDGHGFAPLLVRIKKGNIFSGRAPINDHLVFWFVSQGDSPADTWKNPEQIRLMVLETIKDFPRERIETVKNCDLASVSLTHLRYRAPWEIYLGVFRKGNVTVAGDAMHAMGPFLGQGGSAAMEDAVVLARCLASKINSRKQIGEGLDEYVKERRMRLLKLSTHTFAIGTLLNNPSILMKIVLIVIIILFFKNPTKHTRYNCGKL
jgi:2-polyprenyl-6-methoxyphenol hydroxylase-like FAD-dependent oxidoreductase